MEKCMKENIYKIKSMDKDHLFGKMAENMQDNGILDTNMVLEKLYKKPVLSNKENGCMESV